MAWVELNEHDKTIFVNLDLVVKIEPRRVYGPTGTDVDGSALFVAVARKTDATGLHEIHVVEPPSKISQLMANADLISRAD
jgi:hypothetical protein